MKKNTDGAPGKFRLFLKAGFVVGVIALFMVVLLGYRGMHTLRWGMAECLNWQTQLLSERFIIDEQQNRKIIAVTREYANAIENGQISFWHGFKILRAYYDGPVMLALLNNSVASSLRGFANLSEADRQAFEQSSLQFFAGVKSSGIDPETWKTVRKTLLEKHICSSTTSTGFILEEKIEKYKQRISQTQLENCVALMKAANQAISPAIENAVLDPVEELKTLITSAR